MRFVGGVLVGVVVGAAVMAAIRPPDLKGCCSDLADAAADKIVEELGGGAWMRKALDASGVTALLPRLVGALR